ncbi:MarR family winged helix-turn-helix transcriptional regulator [Desulfotruncus arcticus]|nr:MarR family transcriptional regulator [Desulfotruncus arcticus]
MNIQKTKELHDLLYAFMGMFHEKFLIRFRHEYDGLPWIKKNHAKIMNILYQHNHLTSTEIGKMLDIEKGSLTTIIDQLAEKGMVIRFNDANDRRRNLISLSTAGRDEMNRVMDFYTRKLDVFLQKVDAEEITRFIDSLRYVVWFMKKM